MLEDIKVLCHSSIKINKEKIIYIDPFKIEEQYHDADIIFITHDHYDHYSEVDINRAKNENTIIVIPESLYKKAILNGFKEERIICVDPGETDSIDEITFETVPAYNLNKEYHPKENNWVGYILEIDDVRYYIAGDTDITEENKKVVCDIAFVPVGGTYTMDAREAATLVNEIKPKIAVPIHYGDVVGTEEDAKEFIELLDSDIEGKILMQI